MWLLYFVLRPATSAAGAGVVQLPVVTGCVPLGFSGWGSLPGSPLPPPRSLGGAEAFVPRIDNAAFFVRTTFRLPGNFVRGVRGLAGMGRTVPHTSGL